MYYYCRQTRVVACASLGAFGAHPLWCNRRVVRRGGEARPRLTLPPLHQLCLLKLITLFRHGGHMQECCMVREGRASGQLDFTGILFFGACISASTTGWGGRAHGRIVQLVWCRKESMEMCAPQPQQSQYTKILRISCERKHLPTTCSGVGVACGALPASCTSSVGTRDEFVTFEIFSAQIRACPSIMCSTHKRCDYPQ